MIFGAGNGVTTLGRFGSLAGLTRWLTVKNIMRNAAALKPSTYLRLTLRIPMKLSLLLLSLWRLKWGLALCEGLASPESAADLVLLRAVLRPPPVMIELTELPFHSDFLPD